jgi:hypothetical protein
MSASHKAARIIENVLKLEGDADQGDLSKVLDLLIDADNSEKLPRIQRGLNFAARIKAELDKTGHGAKPFLKTVK